jgi:hypothetical protein
MSAFGCRLRRRLPDDQQRDFVVLEEGNRRVGCRHQSVPLAACIICDNTSLIQIKGELTVCALYLSATKVAPKLTISGEGRLYGKQSVVLFHRITSTNRV